MERRIGRGLYEEKVKRAAHLSGGCNLAGMGGLSAPVPACPLYHGGVGIGHRLLRGQGDLARPGLCADRTSREPAAQPERAEFEPQQPPKGAEKSASTGDPAIDALIAERDRAISEMRRLNDTIEDAVISTQIDHLENITGKIIDAVVDKPSKLPQLRKFLNYYLPTTLKLLNAYDRMDAAGVSGSNIDGTKGKIEDIMGTICKAFDKQLDALYGEEALDISTDITVLENMLAQEGLGDTPFQSPGS